METASRILVKEDPRKRLRDAVEAKKRIYDMYPQSISFAVQEQLKSLNELIRELNEELKEMK